MSKQAKICTISMNSMVNGNSSKEEHFKEIEQLRPEGRMIIRSVSRSVTVKEIMREFNRVSLDDFLYGNNGLSN